MLPPYSNAGLSFVGGCGIQEYDAKGRKLQTCEKLKTHRYGSKMHPRSQGIQPPRPRSLILSGCVVAKSSLPETNRENITGGDAVSHDIVVIRNAALILVSTLVCGCISFPALAAATAPTAAAVSTSSSPAALLIISKITNYLVLAGSLLYKVPQVVRIAREKDSKGISLSMYVIETLGCLLFTIYSFRSNFPFATFGETAFIVVQNFIILALIITYNPDLVKSRNYFYMGSLASIIATAACLSPSIIPMPYISALQVLSVPLSNLSRIPQIVLNYKSQSTGQLSPITLGLTLLGNVARVFTTVVQVKDLLMLVSTLAAMLFNAILFFQWVYYFVLDQLIARSE